MEDIAWRIMTVEDKVRFPEEIKINGLDSADSRIRKGLGTENFY